MLAAVLACGLVPVLPAAAVSASAQSAASREARIEALLQGDYAQGRVRGVFVSSVGHRVKL